MALFARNSVVLSVVCRYLIVVLVWHDWNDFAVL